MPSNTFQSNKCEAIRKNQYEDLSILVVKLKNRIWNLGIPSWLFGITDRSVASFADGYLSAIELFQIITASFLFLSWLYLKPEESLNTSNVDEIQSYWSESNLHQDEVYLSTVKGRMFELQEQHMISQEYILPFPYICQIYHLLNLKHLESIHNFSLNNLKVITVSHFQPTVRGGMIKFQTILDSPVNALRIWRQPIVEVGLILHTPYTVELRIPVYNNKTITVIFNALPLSNTEHKLFIDIYSNLDWPKPLLQLLLHFASCLTLFEDLPYLHKLTERNMAHSLNLSKSNHETMWLFKRFVDLYGSQIKPAQSTKLIAAGMDDTDDQAIATET